MHKAKQDLKNTHQQSKQTISDKVPSKEVVGVGQLVDCWDLLSGL